MIVPSPATVRVGTGVYAGLFFVTLSTLMYEILLTRIFSVTMWYHFAFVAVSIALFGMTVGALIVYLAPGSFPAGRTNERLYQATLLFSATMVATFVVQLFIPFDPGWSLLSISSVAFLYLVISVPFIFSGVAVSLALTRFPQHVGRLYAADLTGAALGTVTLIWLLNTLGDGPSAVFAIAAFAAAGAAFFAKEAESIPVMVLGLVGGVALALFAAGNALAAQNHQPFLRVFQVKGQSESVPLHESWNAFSRIRVDGDPDKPGQPFVLGMSAAYRSSARVRQLSLTIDGTAGTVVTAYDGDPESLSYLRFDVAHLAHHVRPDARVFIIGSGGGRDVLAALSFGQPSVTAVEMNGAILKTVNERYGEFTGHLDEQPGVRFVNDEGRSYLARTSERFDIIQIPFIDTWAATAAGAFALSENSLYTIEAWQGFLDRLSDRGVLSVTRWYMLDRPMEAYRLVSLANVSLREQGVAHPRDHIVMVRSMEGLPFPGIAPVTILVSKAPLSDADLATIERAVRDLDFELVLTPDQVGDDPLFARIAEAENPGSLDLGFPGDISAPTDDRPFFFQMVRFQDLFDRSLYGGLNDSLTRPVLVLFSLAVAVLALTAFFILAPLALTTSRQALRGMFPFVVFFCGIGLGFLLLEISQMQRLIIFLGHPTYALSVVLFSLLLASGIGSLATERLAGSPGSRPSLSLLWPLGLLLAVLVTFGFVTPAAIDQFEAATTPARILTAVAILAPMGFMMGMPFPIGMKLASLRPNAPTPFFWGINGATSVCASVLAVAISMGWGISAAFWVGCVSYAVAAAALGAVLLRGKA